MEVENIDIITIINNNIDYCDYFNKFTDISDTIIRINNKDVLVNKQRLIEYSAFFRNFFNDYRNPTNVYSIKTDHPVDVIKTVISYLYGCDISFNIRYFSVYYKVADYLMIDQLKDLLREDIIDGFNNGKYNISYIVDIISNIYYLGDLGFNEALLNTISRQFLSLLNELNTLEVDILQNIISRDDLYVNSELDLVFFLNKYYAIHPNKAIEINNKLIPNIRMLTLSIFDISSILDILLSELDNYDRLINQSLYSKKRDGYDKANLIAKYKNILTVRTSMVINEFDKYPEMKNYNFKEKKWMQITDVNTVDLPPFPAIIIRSIGNQCLLNTWNHQIFANLSNKLLLPKVGSMILIVNSKLMQYRADRENQCYINQYEVIFDQVPDLLYK